MIPDIDKVVASALHATDAPLTLSENLGLRLVQNYRTPQKETSDGELLYISSSFCREKFYREMSARTFKFPGEMQFSGRAQDSRQKQTSAHDELRVLFRRRR